MSMSMRIEVAAAIVGGFALVAGALLGCGGQLSAEAEARDAGTAPLDPATCFVGIASTAPIGSCTTTGMSITLCGGGASLAIAEVVTCPDVGGEKRRPDRPGCREDTRDIASRNTESTTYVCDPVACAAAVDGACEGRAFTCASADEARHGASARECVARGASLCCAGY